MAKSGSYKTKLAEALRDRSLDQSAATKIFSEAIGAASGASAIPSLWARDVALLQPYPASAFWDNPNVKWHDDPKGSPGGTVYLPYVWPMLPTTGSMMGVSGEPTSTASVIGNTVAILYEYACPYYIQRYQLEDVVEDTITQLNEQTVKCLDKVIDDHFIAACTGSSYGSVVVAPGTLGPADIAQTIGSIRTGTYEPVFGVMHPRIEATLMGSSQFTNAATFGDRSVITGGHITRFLGVDFAVIPSGSLISPGLGTYTTWLFARNILQGVKKRDPDIQTQFLVQPQSRYVYTSVRFAGTVIASGSIGMGALISKVV